MANLNRDRVVSFETILAGTGRLPTLPGIAIKILEAVQKPEPDLAQIAGILATDPPLSAEVLKVINSSFYALPKKITNVLHAVNMLGLHTVKNLALSFSLVKGFGQVSSLRLDYARFWKQSLIGAVSAKLLARNILPQASEDAFFLALLKDIGILTLAQCIPDQYQLVLREVDASGSPYHEVERQILGFDHLEVGAYLTRCWGLPDTFYLPIGCHHPPKKQAGAGAEIDSLIQILHLATLYGELFFSPEMGLALKAIEHYVRQYGWADKLRVAEIVVEIDQKTREVLPLFDIQLEEESRYLEMLEAARSELINVSSDVIATLLAQQQQIEMLKEQIIRDPMTRLYNYQHFYEMLHQEAYRAQRYHLALAVIIGDLDHFKSINDSFGHPAGDETIRQVANCLSSGLRQSDCVARYGGEEFAILLPETDLKGALMVCERLRKAISDTPIPYENSVIKVTMSFGLTFIGNGSGFTCHEIIKRADDALYKAKASGRNRCCVYLPEDQGL
jgi:two-component system, cell cycle response regulator